MKFGVHFYPRSPCGERRDGWKENHNQPISIHSLRRATTIKALSKTLLRLFLSTLSLRRATDCMPQKFFKFGISIHALLAESDRFWQVFHSRHTVFLSTLSLRRATPFSRLARTRTRYFYPRSPCGERLDCRVISTGSQGFLSTLSLRRATWGLPENSPGIAISIHALLAESDYPPAQSRYADTNFYPRSPCGERLNLMQNESDD